jgi:HK97 family phage prohead protease
MGAIAIHHTETSTGNWDGPANEARLKLDGTEAYYRSAYAWQDAVGDPATKAAYRFIHHEIAGDGSVGAANNRAASTGIGGLNGGRGGTTIPAADRRGVYNHLAAHLRDADLEAPPLRVSPALVEHRAYPLQDLRVEGGDSGAHIRGYAAVFNSLSEPLGLWGPPVREKIRPGAFSKTLREADIRALWNHDPSYVLGRNKAATLSLAEDARGLAVDVTPPETQWARDLAVSMRRGDVNQMSFGFQVVRDEWEKGHDAVGAENVTRTLVEVKLFDVSVVTFPAYPTTSAGMRDIWSAMAAEEENESEMESIGHPLQVETLPETIIGPEAIIPRTPPEIGHLRMDEARRRLDRYQDI